MTPEYSTYRFSFVGIADKDGGNNRGALQVERTLVCRRLRPGRRLLIAFGVRQEIGDRSVQLKSIIRRTLMVSAATATTLVVFGGQASAHAHTLPIYGAGALIGNAQVEADHLYVKACDFSADGVGIRAEYKTTSGVTDMVGDANGSASGCGREHTPSGFVSSYRVCDSTNRCSSWVAP
ncbi:hypothetical protein MRQ36_09245 [Micromonospora sp. R77]|uniref:hypothetical protein n=1 Tax=Micromonospora sp. R77 TaxID=2925836 RepID=UPI001F61D7B4|nr:hypothetical protein [Micromonospora sp. R77]MCI4062746.1 hypothetical protein [Micromonospora sp. R77]